MRDRLPEGADAAFWDAVRGNLDLMREARQWWEVARGTVVPPMQPGEGDFLRAALDALPPEPWGKETWTGWTNGRSGGR